MPFIFTVAFAGPQNVRAETPLIALTPGTQVGAPRAGAWGKDGRGEDRCCPDGGERVNVRFMVFLSLRRRTEQTRSRSRRRRYGQPDFARRQTAKGDPRTEHRVVASSSRASWTGVSMDKAEWAASGRLERCVPCAEGGYRVFTWHRSHRSSLSYSGSGTVPDRLCANR